MPGWMGVVEVAVGIEVGTGDAGSVSVSRAMGKSRLLFGQRERGYQSVELNSSILDARRACIMEEVTV